MQKELLDIDSSDCRTYHLKPHLWVWYKDFFEFFYLQGYILQPLLWNDCLNLTLIFEEKKKKKKKQLEEEPKCFHIEWGSLLWSPDRFPKEKFDTKRYIIVNAETQEKVKVLKKDVSERKSDATSRPFPSR